MDIDDSSSLVHFTYYMMDWAKLAQKRSATRCISCGGQMMSVEPIRDRRGTEYEGLVCHSCKSLLWSRTER
jgi:uncharacterized protein with PIN domain